MYGINDYHFFFFLGGGSLLDLKYNPPSDYEGPL